MILKDESLCCRQIKFCDKIIHRWQDEIEHFIWISHASGEIDLSFASFSPQILIRIIFNLQQVLLKSVPPTICFCIKWVVNLFYSSHEKTSSLHIKIGLYSTNCHGFNPGPIPIKFCGGTGLLGEDAPVCFGSPLFLPGQDFALFFSFQAIGSEDITQYFTLQGIRAMPSSATANTIGNMENRQI